ILHAMMRLFDQEKDFMLKPRPLPGLFKYLDMPYYHPTMFVPKEIYDDVGVYSLDYQYAMDYDFVLRALGKGYRFQYLPKLITHFRHGGSANSNALACHKEVLESQIRNGLNLLVCRLTYYFKVMVNKLKGLVAKSL
ncbi:MAG: hypothetical protein OEZ36_00245, partial [Spirochaetota bacterium]|nr:hypothetical protein [Spirochaetota bacterium]